MNGYFLEGIENESVLVIRTDNSEDILKVINKLSTSRDKEIRALAGKLEKDFYDRYIRNNCKSGPENKKKDKVSDRNRVAKTANTKRRAKPST